jgi:glyoxylase-like metal-dependent hydrolase (beta-lactamase superfamily II)
MMPAAHSEPVTMRRHRVPLSLAFLALSLSAPTAAAQSSPTVLESYQRARTLIELAVAAHGGVDALRAARKARVRISGWDYHPTQGRRIAPPFDSTVRLIDAMIDLDRSRIVYEQTRGWPGGFHYTNRFVTKGDTTYNISTRNHNYSIVTASPASQQYGNLFAFPQWLLLSAHETTSPAVRRYLGRMRLGGNGAEVEAIHYSLQPQGNVVIGLDPTTHRLRAVMSVAPDVFTGDTEVTTEYLDWKPLDGMLLPTWSEQRRGGHVVSRQRFMSAQANYQIPDSLLAPPAHFTLSPPNPQAMPVQELAAGVWLVGTGSKSLVVAFNDHLVVVDAPAGGSADVIRRAAEFAPGKPIRYVVPTHHHDDHFAGVRVHAANGATVVTTPGTTDYLRRIMTAPMSSAIPASSQVPPRTDYRVETVSGGRRVFSDGSRTLEVHQMASPHADEMLVAWLPAEGILFQADLIEAPAVGVALRGANAEATAHLARVIREKGWSVRTFTGAHATLRSPAEFASLVSLPIIPPGQ